jgi:hypothetical protein
MRSSQAVTIDDLVALHFEAAPRAPGYESKLNEQLRVFGEAVRIAARVEAQSKLQLTNALATGEAIALETMLDMLKDAELYANLIKNAELRPMDRRRDGREPEETA